MPDLITRTVPVSDLVHDPMNARTHDEKNIDAIKRSLDSFGQRKPLVVARGNDNEMVVIAGNGTLEAARSLGWSTIVIAEVPADWDASKARAFALADNRSAELADWDDVALTSALFELDANGWDIADLGFEPIAPPDGDEWADAMGNVTGDRQPIQQMTFTLHDDQVETLRNAIAVAKGFGEFGDTGNPNANGNALARIAEMFLGYADER